MKSCNCVALLLILLCCHSISAAATSVIQQQIAKNQWQYYQLDLDTPSQLTIKLRKMSNDVDLYVSRAKKPTKDDFLCAPKRSSAMIETCRLNTQKAGKWFIGIYGKTDSNYQLGVRANDCELISLQDIK